jgi:hypothetical protein
VKAGDHVILYTKRGTDKAAKRKDGATNHFFYWGMSAPLWREIDTCAVLIEIGDCETSDFGHIQYS